MDVTGSSALPALQARDLYQRAQQQRDMAAARQRARDADNGISAPVVRRGNIDRQSKLYQAALDFESIFVKQMLDAMRKTVNKSGLIEGGMAEDIFEDMLYEKYATTMTRSAGFGLADQIYRQLAPGTKPAT
jgi:Rod binding domain-containing protein